MLGFDNAHAVSALGRNGKRPSPYDHWHRSWNDPGRPYHFVDAATLVKDFFSAVGRFLKTHDLDLTVVGESPLGDASSLKRSKPQ